MEGIWGVHFVSGDTESSVDLGLRGGTLHNDAERLSYSATPPDFGSLCIQRRRWADGGLLILPRLLRQVRAMRGRGEPIANGELLLRLKLTRPVAGGGRTPAPQGGCGPGGRRLDWASVLHYGAGTSTGRSGGHVRCAGRPGRERVADAVEPRRAGPPGRPRAGAAAAPGRDVSRRLAGPHVQSGDEGARRRPAVPGEVLDAW